MPFNLCKVRQDDPENPANVMIYWLGGAGFVFQFSKEEFLTPGQESSLDGVTITAVDADHGELCLKSPCDIRGMFYAQSEPKRPGDSKQYEILCV